MAAAAATADGSGGYRDGITQMRGFIHHDQIAEKLEIARTIGILTDYFIGPSVQRPDTSVWVSRNPNVSDEAVKNYLIRLLHGFVLDHQIIVTAPMATRERTEPGNGTAVAVAAA